MPSGPRSPTWTTSSRAVEQLTAKPGGELQIHRSCALAHTLHDAGLIDECRLIVFPVVVGQGKRLFPDGSAPGVLTLLRSTTTSLGTLALTLQPAGVLGRGDITVVDGKEFIHKT